MAIHKIGSTSDGLQHLLSERRNIVVFADEAHCSHHDFLDALARHMRDHMPRPSFIVSTAMPHRA